MSIKKALISIYENIYKSDFILSTIYKKKCRNSLFNILTPEETINYIINNSCSVSRFGEGELELIIHQDKDLGFQRHSIQIADRLEKVLSQQNGKLLICLPHALNTIKSRTRHSRMFWYNWCFIDAQRKKTVELISRTCGMQYRFGDTQISRPFIAFQSKKKAKRIFNSLKRIWDNTDIMIVEGKFTCLGVGNDLFSNSKSIKRVLCPPKNAFDSYDKILDEVKRVWHGELVIIALGPTATILASDLSQLDIRAIDIGHLDIEYEWFRRGSQTHAAINGKFTNESEEGHIVSECTDPKYLSEIIANVGS